MSTHNICFRREIRKKKYLLETHSYRNLCPIWIHYIDLLTRLSEISDFLNTYRSD